MLLIIFWQLKTLLYKSHMFELHTGPSAPGFKSTHDQVEALKYHSPDLNPGRFRWQEV